MARRNSQTPQVVRPSILDAVKVLVTLLPMGKDGYNPLTKPVLIDWSGRAKVLTALYDVNGDGKPEECRYFAVVNGQTLFADGPKDGYEPLTFQAWAERRGYSATEIASVTFRKAGETSNGAWSRTFLIGHLPPKAGRTASTVPTARYSAPVAGL